MPSKKKKYNARFPASRIKKIMQTDEEVGKVAQAVPVIISRTLELFVESLLTKSMQITQARNAKTLTPSHMKQCILSESRFDFLKDLVKDIPDASVQDDNDAEESVILRQQHHHTIEREPQQPTQTTANFYTEQGTSGRTPVIQYGPKIQEQSANSSSHNNKTIHNRDNGNPQSGSSNSNIPSLVPIQQSYYGNNTGDNLYIDEDYDN